MTYSKEASAIIEILADRPVAYHPALARAIGGVKAAIFLGQLLYWNGKGVRDDGWIWKTVVEMEEETALTRAEQEGARAKLGQAGVLEVKRMGPFGRLHYRLDLSALQQKLETCLGKSDKQEKQEIRLRKIRKQPVALIAENPQTISETTISENTNIAPAGEKQPAEEQSPKAKTSPEGEGKRQKREPTGRNLVKKRLEGYFALVSGIPPPTPKSQRDRRAASERWWKPLLRVAALVEDDVGRAKALIDEALRQMDEDGLTVSAPASVVKVAISIHARRTRQGGRVLKVA